MFVKINFEPDMSIMELSKFCGTAPCTILAANRPQTSYFHGRSSSVSENDLVGKTILVPVSTPCLICEIREYYKKTPDGSIIKIRV